MLMYISMFRGNKAIPLGNGNSATLEFDVNDKNCHFGLICPLSRRNKNIKITPSIRIRPLRKTGSGSATLLFDVYRTLIFAEPML